MFSEPQNPDKWEVNGEVVDASYVADNGDRYFSVEDFWVIVSYSGPNNPRSIRIEPKGTEH